MRSTLKNMPGCRRSGGKIWCWLLTVRMTDTAVRERIQSLIREHAWQGGFEGGHGLHSLLLTEDSIGDALPILTADVVLRGSRIEWNAPLVHRLSASQTTVMSK